MEENCHICKRTLHIVCQGCGRPACVQHSEVLVRCAECGEKIRIGVVEGMRKKLEILSMAVSGLALANSNEAAVIQNIREQLDEVESILNVEDGDAIEEKEEESKLSPLFPPVPESKLTKNQWNVIKKYIEGGKSYREASAMVLNKYGFKVSHSYLWEKLRISIGPKKVNLSDEPLALSVDKWGTKEVVTYILERLDAANPGQEISSAQIFNIARSWKTYYDKYKNETSFVSSTGQALTKKLLGKRIAGKILRSRKDGMRNVFFLVADKKKSQKSLVAKVKKDEDHDKYVDTLLGDIEEVLATDEPKHVGMIVDELMESPPYSKEKKSALASSVFRYTKQMVGEKMSSDYYPHRRIRSELDGSKLMFWSVEMVPHKSSNEAIDDAKKYGKMLEETFK